MMNQSAQRPDEMPDSRRDFLKKNALRLAATVSTASPGLEGSSQPAPPKRPNIVFIMGDGVRADELSLSGNKLIETPNIDRIGREGITFSNAFATNAVCAPSRASMLTGLYSCRNGVKDNEERTLRPNVPFLPTLLSEAGYEVAFCGKSHINGGLRQFFWNYYFGYIDQQPYVNASIAEGFDGKIGADKVREGYADDLITDSACNWLKRDHQKPFCLFLWLKAPHDPYMPPRRLAMKYDDGTRIAKPLTFDEDLKGYPGKPRAFAGSDLKIGVDSHHIPTLESLVKAHYACTIGLDQNVGKVLRTLEETNQLDRSLALFTSDHGYFLGEWHFLDKRLMHEPSIRIPLLMRLPGAIKPGSTNDDMVLNVDIAPSILDFAGVAAPRLQGHSLLPLVEGQNSQWRKDWFYAYYGQDRHAPRNRGVRTERFKLIEYWAENPPEYELYDLQADPLETHNLYGNPQYAGLQHSLLQRMTELREEVGDA